MISELCIWDMATGAARVLMSHESHIEAPNWHPDGYLIVNGDGLIYRVPLDSPRLKRIDTGFAIGCNNDHGVSPDGTLLAISDNSQTGQSCIYVLPIGGGIPRRVTEHTHGGMPGRRMGKGWSILGQEGTGFFAFTVAPWMAVTRNRLSMGSIMWTGRT